MSDNPAHPEKTVATPPRLLDQVRDRLRLKHYSIRTEQAYVGWIKRYIIFHNKRHPAEMGKLELESFLTSLAVERNVSARLPRPRRFLRCCFCTRRCWSWSFPGWMR
jgi:hypothetical protein